MKITKKLQTVIAGLAVGVLGLAANINPAFATSFNMGFTGASEFEADTYWSLQASNISGDGLLVIVGSLNYDSSKINVTASAASGLNMTQGSKIVLDTSTPLTGTANVLNLTISNKSLATGESTTISFTGITGSDGESDITTANASKTITWTKAAPVEPTPAPTPTPEPTPAQNNTSTPTNTSSTTRSGTTSNNATTTDTTNATNNTDTQKTDSTTSTTNNNTNTQSSRTKVQGVTNQTATTDKGGNIIWLVIIIVAAIAACGLIIWLVLGKKKKSKKDKEPQY